MRARYSATVFVAGPIAFDISPTELPSGSFSTTPIAPGLGFATVPAR